MRGLIYKELKMAELTGSIVIMLILCFLLALIDPVPLTFAIEEDTGASQLLGNGLFASGIMGGLLMGFVTSGIGFPLKETLTQNRFYTTTPAGVPGVLAAKYAASFIAVTFVGAVTETANICGRLIAPYKTDLTAVIVFVCSLFLLNNAYTLTMTAWFGRKKMGAVMGAFLGFLFLISFLYFLFGDITPYLELMFPEKETEPAEMIQKLTSSGVFRTLSVIIMASVSVMLFVLSYFIGLPGYIRQIGKGEEE